MEKYGFFGGSFNPVTKAHIELALDIVKKFDLDKVIFVPVGDFYKKANLASGKDRFEMLKIATRNYKFLDVSSIELNETKNLSTLEAFEKIEKEYKMVKKYYIIGADNLEKLSNSNDNETLAKNYKYIIIQRGKIDCNKIISKNKNLENYKENFEFIENKEHTNTSATNARENLKSNTAEKILQKEVLDYIKKNGLYL